MNTLLIFVHYAYLSLLLYATNLAKEFGLRIVTSTLTQLIIYIFFLPPKLSAH